MDSFVQYFLWFCWAAAFILGGYGLLLLGRLINEGLRKGRDKRWLIYVAAVLGLGLLFAEYVMTIDPEWTRAIGGMLLALAVVTLINYKGRKLR